MGVCSECGLTKRLSTKGLVYTHLNPLLPAEECAGSRKPVRAVEVPQDESLERVVTGPEKAAYTLEALLEWERYNAKPRPKGFWARVRDWLWGCCD
jgi:hypothetical protein